MLWLLFLLATVAQAGAFKIGDTAGTLDNIIACKLYRPGSVGFASKSGDEKNYPHDLCHIDKRTSSCIPL